MWLAVTGIHPRLPAPNAHTKQGSFPPTAFSCAAISGTVTPSDSLRAEDRFHVAAYTTSLSIAARPLSSPVGSLRFPDRPCPRSAPSTPGGSSPLHFQVLRRLLLPSPNLTGLGSS